MSKDYLETIQQLRDEAPDAEGQGAHSALAAVAAAAAALFAAIPPAKADLSYELSQIYHRGDRELLKLKAEQMEENARLGIDTSQVLNPNSPNPYLAQLLKTDPNALSGLPHREVNPLTGMYVPTEEHGRQLMDLVNRFQNGTLGGDWSPSPSPSPASFPAVPAFPLQAWASCFMALHNAALADMAPGQLKDLTLWLSTPDGFTAVASCYNQWSQLALMGLNGGGPDAQRSAIALSAVLCNTAGYGNAPAVFQYILSTLQARNSPVLRVGNLGALFAGG